MALRHWLLVLAISSFAWVPPGAAAASKGKPTHPQVQKKPHSTPPGGRKKTARKASAGKQAARKPAVPSQLAGKPKPPAAEPALPTVTVTANRFSTDLESFLNEPGDYRFAIQHKGLTRTYRVHVPVSYDRTEPAPLLVALHGNGHNMDDPAIDAYYGLVGKSEREGFVAVFPNAAAHADGRQPAWNSAHADDVGFVRQVVTNVFRQVSISRNRIYAAGMSSGGTLAYRLACELPEVFRAVATVAASDDAGGCTTPARPVSVLHIQARNDAAARAAGSARGEGRLVPVGFPTGRDTAARWAHADGCSPMPRNVLEKDGVSCQAWSWCRAQAEVQLCVTDSGGQSWPGARKLPRGETPSTALSATDTMWAFFSRH